MKRKIFTGILVVGIGIGIKYMDYLNYRNNLILEYGKNIYNLMNTEIGVNSEFESFKYYLKYNL